jgi:triosephosphate isomerase
MSEIKRTPIAAGNWKMNLLRDSARKLIDAVKNLNYQLQGVEIIVAPPAIWLPLVQDWLSGSDVKIAGQNMHWEEKGAFTGEISPAMLKDSGCTYVLIGHSERRHKFGENDEWINKKVRSAVSSDLKPILCVGEKIEEREKGKAFEVVEKQLESAFEGLGGVEMMGVVIAYEPVWAIGTGKNALPGDAQEMHRFIREWLKKKFGEDTAQRTRIIYGGSVTPSNITEFIQEKDIDGTLSGGASIKAETFLPICKSSIKR